MTDTNDRTHADDKKNGRSTGQTRQEGWTVDKKINVLSIVSGLLIALCSGSGIVSLIAKNTSANAAKVVETTRVETGDVITNSNYNLNSKDYSNPWVQWTDPVTEKTLFVGLKRKILFEHPFDSVPHVSTSIGLMDTKPADLILAQLGYRPPDEATAQRLHDIHLVTEAPASQITPTGFTLYVGIGLPTNAAEWLENKFTAFQNNKNQWFSTDQQLIDNMIQHDQFPRDRTASNLDRNEIWLLNFYKYVGAVRVAWIAQSREQKP